MPGCTASYHAFMESPTPEENEERAVPVDLGVVWTDGGPMPTLLEEGGRAFLAFRLAPVDPSGDDVGVIEWLHCWATSYGYPNDEAITGHRLWGQGLSELSYYGAAEVFNSAWI